MSLDPSQDIDIRTWWWLPEDPEAGVAGRLVVQPGVLGQVFVDGKLSAPEELGTHDTVWGNKIDGGATITLLRTLRMAEYGPGDTVGARCAAKWILVGAHVPHHASERVVGLRIRWDRIEHWYRRTYAPAGPWWNGEALQVEKLETVLESFALPTFDANFEMTVEGGTTHLASGSVEMWHQFWWELKYNEPQSLDRVALQCAPLRDFVSLAFGEPVVARAIEVGVQLEDGAEIKWLTLLGSICYGPTHEDDGEAAFMCLPYRQIAEHFSTILKGWTAIRVGELAGAFTQWRWVLSDERLPVERLLAVRSHFLDAVLPDVPIMEKAKFRIHADRACAALPADIPAPIREAMSRKIREANHGTFRDRLTHARNALPADVVAEYGLDDAFIGNVAKARNRLTHDGNLGDLDLSDAIMICSRTRLFAIAYVLQAIGLPADKILRRLKARFRWAPPIAVGKF